MWCVVSVCVWRVCVYVCLCHKQYITELETKHGDARDGTALAEKIQTRILRGSWQDGVDIDFMLCYFVVWCDIVVSQATTTTK